MRTTVVGVLVGLALLAGPAAAQSRLQRLEAAGASSALDRFEFGRKEQRPPPPRPILRPVAPRPILDRLPRVRPVERDDDEAEAPVARRPKKPARPAVAEAPPPKPSPPAPPPDLWASRVESTTGWGPLDLD